MRGPKPKMVAERFWPKVISTPIEEWTCWEWIGSKNGQGYGKLSIRDGINNHKLVPAHRVSYELHWGEIPNGKVVDHICGNRGCVNPDHLQAVTHNENHLREITRYSSKTEKYRPRWPSKEYFAWKEKSL